MKHEIFIVNAYIVDANGNFNFLSGYPKPYDSKHYGNDVNNARCRALSDYYSVLSTMATRTDRQLQRANVIVASNGSSVGESGFGSIADLPDPEPEEETAPEQTT
jgi:hypothetical protein